MRKRLLPPAAFAVVVAVAAAACDGTSSSNGTATTARHTTTHSARQKAAKLTACLRAHGVRDFPDPDASGEFPSYGISVTPAVWTRAVAACKSVEPPGAFSAKMTHKELSAALKFARCVRAHGVPDFPDPVSGQPLIDTTHIPSSNKPGGMTILNAATNTCGNLLGDTTGGH